MTSIPRFRQSDGPPRSTFERTLQHVWRCRSTYYIAAVTTLTLLVVVFRRH